MGKPTGFLDYERELNPSTSPKERIKNFNEFHKMISHEAVLFTTSFPNGMTKYSKATGSTLSQDSEKQTTFRNLQVVYALPFAKRLAPAE